MLSEKTTFKPFKHKYKCFSEGNDKRNVAVQTLNVQQVLAAVTSTYTSAELCTENLQHTAVSL